MGAPTDDLLQLRTKLEKIELALSAIIDAIVWTDDAGRIQWFSSPFRRLVGKPDTEIVGASLTDLLPLEDNGRQLTPAQHPVARALAGQPNAIGSYEFRKPERTLILEILAARVQVSRQERSTVVSIRDVTARKQAEEQVKQLAAAATASAESERRRAAELDRAYRELKETQNMLVQAEKMAAIGQLASGIAHEVKNPLGIILQGVNFLEEEISQEQAQQVEVLKMIKEAVRRSDKIVRDLLKFSRQAPVEAQPCDLAAVMAEALTLVEQQLVLKNITVVREFAAGLPAVMLDDNQMKQVFINIIMNAIHAMPQGGALTLRARRQVLEERQRGVGRRATDVFHPGQVVVVGEVVDTGCGIPAESLAKVFEPFFTTKPAGEGTGLGLAITRSIIERHRGLIDIDSRVGHGTTMRIVLPLPDGPDG